MQKPLFISRNNNALFASVNPISTCPSPHLSFWRCIEARLTSPVNMAQRCHTTHRQNKRRAPWAQAFLQAGGGHQIHPPSTIGGASHVPQQHQGTTRVPPQSGKLSRKPQHQPRLLRRSCRAASSSQSQAGAQDGRYWDCWTSGFRPGRHCLVHASGRGVHGQRQSSNNAHWIQRT